MQFKFTIFLVVAFVFTFPLTVSAEGPQTIKLNGGLEAEVVSIGRNKERNTLSISMKIANKGKNAVHLLLVGSAPVASDNTGNFFELKNGLLSGLAFCRTLDPAYVSRCLAAGTEDRYSTPLQEYTQIDPGIEVTVNFGMYGRNKSQSPLVSFSANVAYRLADDPLKEDATPEVEKRKRIRIMSLTFPPSPVVDEAI